MDKKEVIAALLERYGYALEAGDKEQARAIAKQVRAVKEL